MYLKNVKTTTLKYSKSINPFLQLKFYFSTKIIIPFNKIDVSFCRSSGAGGQSVNKVNSKVELRFNLSLCDWISTETKQRLKELYPNKINSNNEFIVTSQEHRTQDLNIAEAKKKLQSLIEEASKPKHERIIVPFEETQALEERRLKAKKVRSDIKKMRNNAEKY